jgi:uncharacterized protein (TIGR02302 family)
MTEPDRHTAFLRLRWPLRLTLAGLWAERIVRGFWPLWTVLLVVLAVLAFGGHDSLPVEVVWGGTVLAVLGAAWGLWYAYRHFRKPNRAEALARLDARLPGRPIAALQDTQAIGAGDPASQAVWAAHLARMAQRAAAAKPVSPDLRLAARDPFALRYVALTAFVMALMFGSLWRVTSATVILPGGAVAATGPTWEGWAQPPAYTGKPSLYLNEVTQADLSLPVGTRLQFRLYGEVGQLTLNETVSARTDAPPASDAVHDFTVTQSGNVTVAGDGGQSWEIAVIADAPPTIAPEGEIVRKGTGEFNQGFTVTDDYGITMGQVTIALDLPAVTRRFGLEAEPEAREPVVLDLPMPVTGDRAAFSETLVDDLSEHPFANLPVTMTFQATDAAGQVGAAEPVKVVLPGKRFFDPMAAALIEMRRDLLWTRENAPRAVQILKAITNRPEALIRNERAYLRLRVALRRLDADQAALTPEARDEIAAELWDIALLVEEGDLASALDRLRRAQARLDEAIRNGADPEEIDRLMAEMQEATQDYIRELAEEQQRNGEDPQTAENFDGPVMSADQLQQMLDELQRLMEEGKTAEAAELMEQIREFMENMQIVEGQGGQGQGGPGQQAMRDMQERLRDQQELSDETFQDLQGNQDGEANEGQQGQQGQQPGQGQQGQNGQGQQPGQGQGGDQQGGDGQGGRSPYANDQDGDGGAEGRRLDQPGGDGQGEDGQGGRSPYANDEDGDGGAEGRRLDQQGGGGGTGPDNRTLAERQRDLQRQLDALGNGQLPGDGTEQGEAGRQALEDAARAMDEAERALRDGDLNGALDKQAEAMDAMREGMRQFGEALAQEQRDQQGQPGQPGQEGQQFGENGDSGGDQYDPLGRNLAGEYSDGTKLGGTDDVYRRAQDLLEEIRRRSGDQERSESERDYLQRLLDLF